MKSLPLVTARRRLNACIRWRAGFSASTTLDVSSHRASPLARTATRRMNTLFLHRPNVQDVEIAFRSIPWPM